MAASFIRRSDGNYFLRLTENTTRVRFSAISSAGNTYTLFINGTAYVSKPNPDPTGSTFYTSSASPPPAGGTLNNSRFPGTEIQHVFGGSGLREYLLSFSAGPVAGSAFYLGGESLNWGTGLYAYPGSGSFLTPARGVGIKLPTDVRNSGTLTHIFDNNTNQNQLFNGSGASFQNFNQTAPDGIPCGGSFNYSQKFYRVTWNTPFLTPNYDVNVTILDNQSASGQNVGFMSLCSVGQKTTSYVDVQFYATNVNGIGYVRSFSINAVDTSWANSSSIFVKQSGAWREVLSAYVKVGGQWRRMFINNGNSSWINILEQSDDAIDFAVQVAALN